MNPTPENLNSLRYQYHDELVRDVLEFWLPDSVDQTYGGYITARDRDGSLLDTDKSVWQQGRFAWLLAKLYTTVDQNDEWLKASLSGISFLENHCFDKSGDGRMWFQTTQDGQPLRKRRYYFSECFTAMAYAAYANASQEAFYETRAIQVFDQCLRYYRGIDALPPKFENTRPTVGIGPAMILLNIAHQIEESLPQYSMHNVINEFINDIEQLFVKPDLECVMESVSTSGDVLNHFDTRTLNPGHAIECAWFILHQAKKDRNPRLIKLGCQMLDWMWARGWDSEYGGLLYFVDIDGKPVQDYWHDMKFWWPHAEAEIACLLAWQLTKDPDYWKKYLLVRDYSRATFADPEYGEWFGYVHRDGRLSSTIKGNLWKGPFHIPRMLWYCWSLLSEIIDAGPQG